MWRREDRVTITNGKYTGRIGTMESNVYQRTVDYPNDLSNGFQVMLDAGDVVILRWDQVYFAMLPELVFLTDEDWKGSSDSSDDPRCCLFDRNN